MSCHRYAARALAADYGRAAAGLILTVGPIISAPPAPAIRYTLLVVAVLFFVFGARMLLRQFIYVEITTTGIRSVGPFAAEVDWTDVTSVDLRYYSTRIARARG